MGRGAALPAMRSGNALGKQVFTNYKMNGYPNRDVSENGRAVDELTGMRHALAQRAIWVVIARKWVTRPIRLGVDGNAGEGGYLPG